MRKDKSEAVSTAGMAYKSHERTEIIGETRIKVTVHIPDAVQNRQSKINRIYDILKPVESKEAV